MSSSDGARDRRRALHGLLPGFVLMLAAVSARAAAPPAPAEPFAVAGISSAEASRVLRELQAAVAARDALAVAALTECPLIVNGKRGPTNRDRFVRDFAAIYTAKVRAAVLNQTLVGLFANSKGIMIGNGEVWIAALCDAGTSAGGCDNRRVRVTSINN
jgi:hypothetical protein